MKISVRLICKQAELTRDAASARFAEPKNSVGAAQARYRYWELI
ncbi:hypothetical protein [Nostoc sp.]